MSKPQYYEIVQSITTPEDIISRNIKTQTLNTLSQDLNTFKTQTINKLILNKIGYVQSTMEDAFKVDMYKFQFKVFIDILTKEIKDIKDAIALQ